MKRLYNRKLKHQKGYIKNYKYISLGHWKNFFLIYIYIEGKGSFK